MPIRQTPPQINLSRKPGETPFAVSLDGFFDFSFWMSEELLDLEAQYESVKKDLTKIGSAIAISSKTKSKRFFEHHCRNHPA